MTGHGSGGSWTLTTASLLLLLLLPLWFTFAQAAHNSWDATGTNSSRALLYNTQRNIHANISRLLDNLLRGYDNSVRPDFGGKDPRIRIKIIK